VHNSSTVGRMIDQCHLVDSVQESRSKSAGPFGVFFYPASTMSRPRMALSDTFTSFKGLGNEESNQKAAFLFHHYTSHIVFDMMPFDDTRNPWRSIYPSMARCGNSREHKSLLHALLAQAAGNLACIGCRTEEMSILTTKLYTVAVKELCESLSEASDFSAVLGSMLTLIMAEVYSGISNAWRVHLNGAWNFITTDYQEAPWQSSEAAWITAQSLCLLKIRADTISIPTPTPPTVQHTSLLSSIASRSDFGFATGATPQLMSCVTDITLIAQQLSQSSIENPEDAINKLHRRLHYHHSPIR
jgi:hypothetical protein